MPRDDYRKPALRWWARTFSFDIGRTRVYGEPIYTTCASAGTSLHLLPMLELFYPTKHYAGRSTWSIHVGWLAWALIIRFGGSRA